MNTEEIIKIVSDKKLKITPQRIAVLEAIVTLNNHPTVDNIKEYIQVNYPHIAVGTIYKILETFVVNNIVKKVFTDNGNTRYDPVINQHHHLYCTDSERIEDYYDDELDQLLTNYFKRKKIKGLTIENMKLQIIGKFSRLGKK